ncbi:hypothetical protein GCM10011506_25340 [Marivirga lumbricoides]|uniref:Uncharacterized protein n=1 Tax=Marivirga lumbricoides TaxID=1046115 RepID=A0ABQ1MHR2_9BACT|nr:hypothetical protein GCM10011506_25340 [Marivirga lumbricoides]
MIATTKLKSLRSIGLILTLGFFTISGGYATSDSIKEEKKKTEDSEKKSNLDPDKKGIKADSISNFTKKVEAKTDSTASKSQNPSSMSSMSYNILFQVIYRFSFSEIFDSPSSSEIVSH